MSLDWPGCPVQETIYVFKNTQGQKYKHVLVFMGVCLKQEAERWRNVGMSGRETYPAHSLRCDGEWNPIVPVIKLIFPDYSVCLLCRRTQNTFMLLYWNCSNSSKWKSHSIVKLFNPFLLYIYQYPPGLM